MHFKRRHKINNNNEIDNQLKETRLFARIGIMILNVFITLVCLNIFFYHYIIEIIPRIDLLFLTQIVQVIGFSLVIGGNITLYLAYHKLGIYWAYPIGSISKKRKLVKTGIYKRIRHPIYLSFNLFCIGFNMILLDWFLLGLYIIGAIGLYFQAIDEEKILIEYFGKDYLDYKEQTGRFFVKILKKEK
ncbi:MAG: methyltransferase family protein [Candidatus Heimdallarchaeota archaeon]